MNHDFQMKYQSLFKIAWYIGLAMVLLIPIQMIVFIAAPPPTTVEGVFELYHHSIFLGLLSLDILYIINNLFIVVIFLTLFIILYHEKPTTTTLALTFGLIGNACYYPSNPAFEMLTLSKKFYAAQPAQQHIFLAAGEALMAGYTGTSFDVYYELGALAIILFSYAILKSPHFKKSIGIWGLLSGIFMIIPSSAGLLGMIIAVISLLPWTIFIILLMKKFKELSIHPTMI